MKDPKRYSMGFKLKVREELRDGKWKTVAEAGEAYRVTSTAIRYWMKRMGFEYLKERIIYVGDKRVSNCKFSREDLSDLSKQTDGYPLRVSVEKR